MDTAFAKMVTDLNGRMHILIEGRIISLEGETTAVNEAVEDIVNALRRGGRELVSGAHTLSGDKASCVSGPLGQKMSAGEAQAEVDIDAILQRR